MTPSVTVVIRDDPRKSDRAAEALRIALGLSTGPNPLTVILLNEAPLLLGEEIDDLASAEILEKHLPVLKELGISFVVPESTRTRYHLDSAFRVREASFTDLALLIAQSDRLLAF